MTTREDRDRLALLEAFYRDHGTIVRTALTPYIEKMRDVAEECLRGYEAIKDDPEKRAAQDKTQITTLGLYHMSQLFTESADKAQAAYRALERLDPDYDPAEDEEEDEVRT
jgi:hypothetical protein